MILRQLYAALGMEVVHLQGQKQVAVIQRMLELMELNISNPVPIAINDGKNRFFSLDMKQDVSLPGLS